MKGLVLLLAGATVLAAAAGANAAPMTAKELAAACAGDAAAKSGCDGYLRALTDFVQVRQGNGGRGKVCLPDGITTDQVRETVLSFAAGKPPRGEPTAIRLVSAAMRSKYPCGGASKAP